MRLSFAHVKPAARAFGIAFVVLGLSRLSEAPGLIAVARQTCDLPSGTIHEGPRCPEVLWATWYAVAAVSLTAFGSGLVTARRRWVAWSLLAISLMWFLHFLAPYFPGYRFALARGYFYAMEPVIM